MKIIVLLFFAQASLAQNPDACSWVSARHSLCKSNAQFDAATRAVKTANGKSIVCEDQKKLSLWERMLDMDISSVMLFPYPLGKVTLPITKPEDPGRYRQYDLLMAAYGENESQVRKNLIDVDFLGQKVPFNRQNGAAAALYRVGLELDKLSKNSSEVSSFLKPWTGWFFSRQNLADFAYGWRKVAGTPLLSTHSFGIALDFTTGKESKPVYWLWEETSRRYDQAKAKGQKTTWEQIKSSISEPDVPVYVPEKIQTLPQKMVDVFEKYGFIWGAKWNRFDSMHFEYRPEMINSQVDCHWEK